MSLTWYRTTIVLLVAIPLLATIAAIVLLWNRYVFATDIALMAGLYMIAGFGVTIGYHRMLTHKSFDAPEWLRALTLICGTTAFEGSPISWAARHVEHHAHSDEEGDPHSPLHGFWHAHIGWLYSIKNPISDVKKYAPHLLQDRTAVFVDRFTPLWMGLSLLIPFLIGGWTGLLWGGGVRIFLITHMTWSVNSVCHTFGKRDFETTDESRNNWIIGLLGFGEGWHNNHHAFPESAMHGLRWWQIDGSAIILRVLESIGLIWNVRRVPIETQQAHAAKSAQMQEARQKVFDELMVAMRQAQEELIRMRDESAESMRRSYNDALARLREIQLHVSLATHLKRQRLRQYIDEVKATVERLRMAPTMA